MSKSCINILQEYVVKHGLGYPVYDIKTLLEGNIPTFECTVKAGEVVCSAKASNKKSAKELCAQNALSNLHIDNRPIRANTISTDAISPHITSNGIDSIDSTHSTGIVINYIGKLNEFCSQNQHPYAVYSEIGNNEHGEFIIACTHGNKIAHGVARNKKDARQKAAQNLLILLGQVRTPPVVIPSVDRNRVNPTSTTTSLVTNIIAQSNQLIEGFKNTNKLNDQDQFYGMIDSKLKSIWREHENNLGDKTESATSSKDDICKSVDDENIHSSIESAELKVELNKNGNDQINSEANSSHDEIQTLLHQFRTTLESLDIDECNIIHNSRNNKTILNVDIQSKVNTSANGTIMKIGTSLEDCLQKAMTVICRKVSN